MYNGPNITPTGLVFGYDTGYGSTTNDTYTRLYAGKPVTNLLGLGYTYGNQNGTYFKSQYGTETSYIPSLGQNVTNHYCNFYNDYPGGSGNCCPSVFSFGGFSVSPNTVYTYQIIYRTPDGYSSPNYMYHYEYGPGGYVTEYGLLDGSRTQSLGDGWVHAWGTFTSNANTNYFYCYLFHYQYIPTKIQIAGVSLTQGNTILRPNQIPNVSTTRTATQSLIDAKRATTIDVSNVSFNTTGNTTFDGTNDYIALPNNTQWYTNDWTWETVIKFGSNSGTYQGIVWAEGAVGGGSGYSYLLSMYNQSYFHYRINNASTGWANTDFTPSGFTPTNYNHLVWQFNNGTTRIYINGTLVHTNTSRGAYNGSTNSPLYVGARNDLEYDFAGEIPVLRFYNRTLTASEIAQNFLGYRRRFNI